MNIKDLQPEIDDVARRTVTLMLKACAQGDEAEMMQNLDVLLKALDQAIAVEKTRQLAN